MLFRPRHPGHRYRVRRGGVDPVVSARPERGNEHSHRDGRRTCRGDTSFRVGLSSLNSSAPTKAYKPFDGPCDRLSLFFDWRRIGREFR